MNQDDVLQPTWRYDYPVALTCPFGDGNAVSLYATWRDVPKLWPCTCGAEHVRPEPRKIANA